MIAIDTAIVDGLIIKVTIQRNAMIAVIVKIFDRILWHMLKTNFFEAVDGSLYGVKRFEMKIVDVKRYYSASSTELFFSNYQLPE